jgi:glycolate oxidase FAD binding subunit
MSTTEGLVRHARPAEPGDAIHGVPPSQVATPASTAQTAEVLRAAAEQGLTVVARGAGTKQTWGAPPSRVDLVVDTTGMAEVVEHAAGDLIVHALAGTRLADLQEALAPAGQRLALDPLYPGTLGGLIATAGAGPLRYSHGTVRDLLIGVTIVRADGVVAKAGGKVVKNVAGYDLGKLLAGSWGTLGVITEATFRLHPLPATSRWVLAPVDGTAAAYALVRAVVHAQTVPSAVELERPADGGGTVAVLVEGTEAGVAGRVENLRGLLGGTAEVRDAAPDWWGRPPAGGALLRLTHELAGLPTLLDALDAEAARRGVRAAVRGSAGVGVLHATLPGDAETVGAVVATLRAASPAWSGDVVVLDGPSGVDHWGPVRGLDLMRRVKDQFDPGHRLAPGRFVGGI